jgi:curli biogenesis system outer membrane secretion channel CsgG
MVWCFYINYLKNNDFCLTLERYVISFDRYPEICRHSSRRIFMAKTVLALAWGALALLAIGCATVSTPQYVPVAAPTVSAATQKLVPAKLLKRKLAIARFSNETRYGRSLLTDGDLDPLGKQASDMMYNRLIASGQFLVFERPDLEKIRREHRLAGQENLVGVDTLVVGSVTEFGRSTDGKVGFLSATKNQVARAKVEVRLIDVKTGLAFFTATGSGEANTETGSIAGYGSRADYDASLNDRAIGAAISDLMNAIVNKLSERPWKTDILKLEGTRAYISGGERQGLKVGDRLAVMREGQKVKSQQTGFEITLPSERLAVLRVTSLFGDSESNEGAICEVVEGALPEAQNVYVTEMKGSNP